MTLLQFYIGIRIAFFKSTCYRATAKLAPTPHRPVGNRSAATAGHPMHAASPD
jgi:hypothetical protein